MRATKTTTSLQISVPRLTAASASQHRSPAYISASTQSITIDIKPHGSGTSVSGFPISANLTATSAGCTSTLTATVCNVQLTLGPGNYDATLTTFDAVGGSGNQLSAAQSMPLNVVEGQANAVPLALGGIPASVQILASGGQAANGQGFVYTLQAGASGTLSAFGVDAAGNTIVGAGAPAITAATDDTTRITVTQPGATTPNAIGITSLGANSIAHITATVTPVAGSGAGPISRTVTVQTPNLPLLYFGTSTRLRIIDMTGTVVTSPSGSGFDSLPSQVVGMAYNSTNGNLYMSIQGGTNEIVAFDKNGNVQPLAAGASTGLATMLGLAFNPSNGWLYGGGQNVAFDASGTAHALSATVTGSYGMTYDPQHNVVVGGTTTYKADGTVNGSVPFTGQIQSVTYNPFNGWFYVATVYPTAVMAYDTSGIAQSLTGSFTLQSGTEQIAGIAADPATGNIFLTTNGNNTYGFDLNGNTLPLPWHDLIGVGAPSDVAGLALLTPQ